MAVPGYLIIALGMLFLLDTMDLLSTGWVMATFWPVAIIALGLSILLSARRWHGISGRTGAAMSNVQFRNGYWDTRDMDTGMGMGELRLDLSRARIPEGDTSLQIKGGMGKIEVMVPAGLNITAQAEVLLGAINLLGHKADGIYSQLSFNSPYYTAAERKVKLQMSLFMGEASIIYGQGNAAGRRKHGQKALSQRHQPYDMGRLRGTGRLL